ncbi:MAG: flagellar biosynthetic protein FliO, partial [Deltaproteobacteria bacterium]|nr:flagellar biosynthetic protein FliO [Deltaproteobacteria bacterium]
GGEPEFGTLSFYVKALGAFILVIACLLIFLKLLGRFGAGRRLKGGLAFTMKGTLPLDSRRYLAAVEVDGRLLIVGVTPERISPIAHWAEDGREGGKGDLGGLPGLGIDEADEGEAPGFARGFGAELAKGPLAAPRGADDSKEPAFYRGKTEEEEAMEARLDLGLDETPFEGPDTNDDFSGKDKGEPGK